MSENYGWGNRHECNKLDKIACQVEKLESKFQDYSDVQLHCMTQQFRNRYASGETLDKLLPEAFAVCREAAKRVLHQRHYHVQIMGGIALHQGRICQMATGEGKTLTETLPAYLNAITGNGVHIVTVNEYLAVRDMEWMGKVFKFLGLTVGVTLASSPSEVKRKAYECDITYGTNNEFGFDYLRDNMVGNKIFRVQRGLAFAIVDEVDSILIDEARTPLIISAPSDKSSEMYIKANRFVLTLRNSTNVDERGEVLGELEGILAKFNRSEDKEQPNGDYVVDMKDKTVRLTDQGVVKAEKYFKLDNLSDPDNSDYVHYINNALKAHAIMHRDDDYIVEKGEVIIVDSFTGRKMEGRRYNGGLHQAIEAKEGVRVQEESVTKATITFQNYFRMYRKLSGMTGTAKTEEDEFNTIYNLDVVAIPTNLPMIRNDRPDLIFTTRKGKLVALVREIAERHQTGQPLLVGTVTVEKSEEIARLLVAQGIKHNVLNAKNHKREAEIIAQAGRVGAVTIATNMAGRGTDILLGGNPEFMAKQEMARLGYTEEQIEQSTSFADGDEEQEKLKAKFAELLAKYKVETDKEKEEVVKLGGLCVMGTERHDSRRIDNQLRGRAGRQGDPGVSVFYISAEDDMLRIFGDDRFKRVLGIMKLEEDEAIESKMLSKLIEQAQMRIEGLHFSARKNVLQYDDVNNLQRKVIYKERNKVIDGENVHDEVLAMCDDYARRILEEACHANENVDEWNKDEVNAILGKYIPLSYQPVLDMDNVTSARQACDMIADKCRKIIDDKLNAPLEEDDIPFFDAERYAMLKAIDDLWVDELEALDDLRQGVGLQSIGQHDPIVVYKKEAYEMFERMNDEIKFRTLHTLFFAKYKIVRRPVKVTEPDTSKKTEEPEEPHELTKKEKYAQIRAQRKAEKDARKK